MEKKNRWNLILPIFVFVKKRLFKKTKKYSSLTRLVFIVSLGYS